MLGLLGRHLLPAVLVRAAPREEHQGGDEADELKRRRGGFAVPRLRPQSGHHGRRHHGRLPRLLGALLHGQHRGRLLQDVHPRHGVQGIESNFFELLL